MNYPLFDALEKASNMMSLILEKGLNLCNCMNLLRLLDDSRIGKSFKDVVYWQDFARVCSIV